MDCLVRLSPNTANLGGGLTQGPASSRSEEVAFLFSSQAQPFGLAFAEKRKAQQPAAAGPCAQYWIRTSTSLRTPPPQDGVSTNFTNWAFAPKCPG